MSVSFSRVGSRTPAQTVQNPAVHPQFPDVVLKKLPFYIPGDVLLRPSSLQATDAKKKLQEQTFSFQLSPSQANLVSSSRGLAGGKVEYRHQVQLRLSLLETTSEQPDNFPKSLSVKVNGKTCSLPNPLPSHVNG